MTDSPAVLLPSLPYATPLPEVVLFGFDELAFPFRHRVRHHLLPSATPQVVLRHGPEGSPDEVVLYYGTVLRIGDTFHLWYNGNFGPNSGRAGFERLNCVLCYATSTDGVRWEKPDLGLVAFKGSRRNNIVLDLTAQGHWSSAAILHEPEDPDPSRRFKMLFLASGQPAESWVARQTHLRTWAAYSPDGLRWTLSANNPVAPHLEMGGITKFRGLYYVNGQSGSTQPTRARRLATLVSADFEHWSPCAAVGLDRSGDLTGPSTDADANDTEQVHLGAGLWNRGNVLLGIYGQWHGHPSGDRRLVTMDLGLALSHDALLFREPIPNYKFIPAREQPESEWGVPPALMQGQGFENVGQRTLYWYSLWRGTEGSGVRLVTWERDRLGMLKPFSPEEPKTITCPIEPVSGRLGVFVNASGLGQQCQLRVSLLDEGFRPLPGYSGAEAAVLAAGGFRTRLHWPGGDALDRSTGNGRVRVMVEFAGNRPEDGRLHAIYIGGE